MVATQYKLEHPLLKENAGCVQLEATVIQIQLQTALSVQIMKPRPTKEAPVVSQGLV